MALDVERVLDYGMDGQEPLRRSRRFEPLRLPLASLRAQPIIERRPCIAKWQTANFTRSSSRAQRRPHLDPLLEALGQLESARLREAPDHEISASSARPGCEREVTAALRPERGVRPMIGDDAKHER